MLNRASVCIFSSFGLVQWPMFMANLSVLLQIQLMSLFHSYDWYCIIDFIDGRNANGTKTMLNDSPQDWNGHHNSHIGRLPPMHWDTCDDRCQCIAMLEFATALTLIQRFRCKDHVYAYCDREIAAVLNCFNSEIEINTQYLSTGGNNCNCTWHVPTNGRGCKKNSPNH